MNSREILQKMGELEGELRDTLRHEWKMLSLELAKKGKSEAEVKEILCREATQQACLNGATWSGGHSVSNLGEQARRESALEVLRHKGEIW